MRHTVPIFALLALAPAPLISLAALEGGAWAWAALGYVTVLSGVIDLLVGRTGRAGEPEDPATAANALSVAIALSFFALLPLVVLALTGATGLPPWARVVLFLAAGFWFGQTVNANAHELIHRSVRGLHNLGRWVYIALLFGHATSAHLKVHHRWAASPRDPLWPRDQEGFYAFAPRAWVGSFRAGWAAENEMRAKAAGRLGLHPYALYLGGGALVLVAAWGFAGKDGVLAYVALVAFAQVQLLLSDYVQHYGLRRAELAGGKLEPIGLGHSWNARHWFTSYMTLNASRHSDHHAHPARPYPALRLPAPEEAPQLPFSLPAMGIIALAPPLWRALMRREIAKWEAIRASAPRPPLNAAE